MNGYRTLGLKLTPQRLAILEFLQDNVSHPSAEDMYRAVKKRFPTISLATVYNTIEVLKKKGVLLELTIDPARKRYDLNTAVHHHLVCLRCKTIHDVNGELPVAIPDERHHLFHVTGTHIQFYGFCDSCYRKGGVGDGGVQM